MRVLRVLIVLWMCYCWIRVLIVSGWGFLGSWLYCLGNGLLYYCWLVDGYMRYLMVLLSEFWFYYWLWLVFYVNV